MSIESGDNETSNHAATPLQDAQLAFIGCGVMAEAVIAGLLRKGLVPAVQIVGSHPRAERREELYAKYGVRIFEENREAVLAAQQIEADAKNISGASLVILAVKPQRLTKCFTN